MFSDSALPILNGVSVSIDALIQNLRGRGHSVHLFTSRYPGHQEQDPNVHRFWALRTPFARDYPLALPPFYPHLKDFRRHHFDVIHTHTPFTIGFVGLRWAQSHDIKLVTTYHTLYDKYQHYIPLMPKRYLRYKLAKHTNFYYNAAQHVITPSDAAKKWLIRHSVHSPVTVIPTGVPNPREIDQAAARQKLGALPRQKVILYVGRVAREKNMGTFFEAMRLVLAADPEVSVWVVGDGPARAQYLREVREMGIGDRVRFFGFIPREQVDEFYAAADLFVFTSMTETQGLVINEAMTYGLPAVVVKGGGAMAAVEDGANGMLVGNDSQAVAAAVLRILEDERLYEILSDGARISARALTVGAMAGRVEDVYRSVLRESGTSRENVLVR